MKKTVLTQKRLTIKELSLFSIVLFYFRFGHHDNNNENFIKLFQMPHSKCLPSFKTSVAQIKKIAHVISYFIHQFYCSTLIMRTHSYYADTCKISNFRNFLGNFTLN